MIGVGIVIINTHLTIELRGDSEIGPLVSLVVQSGGDVEEVRRGKASLEDVFLEMMSDEVLEEENK
jgi:hypothetical protein